jgi:tape measure domain-containing protein
MPNKEFPLSLVVRAVDRATGPLRRIDERLQKLNGPARRLTNSFRGLSTGPRFAAVVGGLRSVGSALGNVASAAVKSVARIGGLAASAMGLAYLFKHEFIDTADTFERLEISLRAIEGDSRKAEKAMGFIKRLTVETPFEMEDIARAFRTMRGFNLDPMNGSLQAIVDQTAKLGLTGEDLTGVAMQLGQAWSKGRLQAQDANILVERGVPVWGLLQRAVERVTKGQKLSVAQLRKMSEAGQLGGKAINLLIEQMGFESQGAAKDFMGSWSGMTSNLLDQWTFFKKSVMDSGPMQALKERLAGILKRIDEMAQSGELQKLADTIGDKLVKALDKIEETLTKLWPKLQAIGASVSWLADLMGGWDNLVLEGLATIIGGPLITALASLAATIVTVGVAIGFTPVGWFLLAIAAIAAIAVLLIKYWDPISTFFVDLWESIKEVFGPAVEWLTDLFLEWHPLGRIIENWEPIKAFFSTLWDGIVTIFKRAWEDIGPIFEKFWSFAKYIPANWGIELAGEVVGAFNRRRQERAALEAERPTLDAAGAAPAQAGQSNEAKVTVDFENMPKGTRVTADPHNGVPMDLSLGYSMVTP